MIRKSLIVITILSMLALVLGCGWSNTQKGAAVGAAGGGSVGAEVDVGSDDSATIASVGSTASSADDWQLAKIRANPNPKRTKPKSIRFMLSPPHQVTQTRPIRQTQIAIYTITWRRHAWKLIPCDYAWLP